MILTLLGTLLPGLLGLVTSALPNFVNYLERGQSNKHELELVKLKMEAAREGLDHSLILEGVKAAVAEGKSLRDHDITLSNNVIINNVRASVRPAVTYFFFILFIGVKVFAGMIMYEAGESGTAILDAIWDSITIAIFLTIIGFWFGSRSLMHFATNYKDVK